MKKYLANMLTGSRILCSLSLLWLPLFSIPFYIAYLLCGLTDMVDGTVARRTDSETEFGAQLDSAADFLFVAAAFIRILPVVKVPVWLWVWIAVIFVCRLAAIAQKWMSRKQFGLEHSTANKVVGFLLFLLPLTMTFIELKYSAAVVCAAATAAALCEGVGCQT